MGYLNKCNNGFYCGAGSNSPTHPWQEAELSVEQPVSKHKLDLAAYELRGALTETRLHFLSQFVSSGCVSIFAGWEDEEKES